MACKIPLVPIGFLLVFTLLSQPATASQYNLRSTLPQDNTAQDSSATWWVPDSFQTIQEAIDSPSVVSGDTIRVRHGIYTEYVIVNKPVALVGEDCLTTIIDGSGTGTVVNITANNVYFSGFTARNGDYGICIFGSTNSTVNGNNANNNRWEGIWLDHSNHCVVRENNASHNQWDGIWLRHSSHCTIERNDAKNNYAYGILVDYFSNNCIINRNNATENWIGLSIEKESNDCTITENTGNNNEYHGLQLYHCQNCTIIRNNVNSNQHYGIYLHFSNHSAVSTNTADSNAEGIHIERSDHCNIDQNAVQNNYYGIWFAFTDHCKAVGNTMSDNIIGAYLYCANNTIMYHNNFVNNTNQTEIIESNNNTWDNGYPSGGNHWSDYKQRYPEVEDVYSGTYQNETGSDGIWDHPYNLSASNQDSYPLMSPFMLGDINRDAKVNILDITIIAKAFGKQQGDDYWNPQADLDENGAINIIDISTAAREFGKEWRYP